MRRLNGTWEPEIPMLTEKLQVEDPRGREYGCGVSGADCLVVVTKRGNARGAKGTGHSRHDRCGQLATGGTARSLRRERQLSLNGKSRVSREAQARFREGLGVQLPGATRPATGFYACRQWGLVTSIPLKASGKLTGYAPHQCGFWSGLSS